MKRVSENELPENFERLTNSIGDQVYKEGNIIVKNVIIYDAISGKKHKDQILKEALIGTTINSLNSPNFSHTIGYRQSDCRTGDEYVDMHPCIELYLRFVPGPTLHKFIQTASYLQIKDILKKLIKAHYLAYKNFDFTHYDLHTENVIITTYETELIPVIIDFGVSHIKIKRQNIGTVSEVSKSYNKGIWYVDIYRIIGLIFITTDFMATRFMADTLLEEFELYKNEEKLEELDFAEVMRLISMYSGVEDIYEEYSIIISKYDDNKYNFKQISDLCVKLMNFFIPGVNSEKLLELWKSDKYWVNLPNGNWKYEDFMKYIN